MEADEGAAARALQPPATEPTAAEQQPTHARRRRRRKKKQHQQQQAVQSQGSSTYAEMAAASLSPPHSGGPELATGGEDPQSSTHGAPPSEQPSCSHTVPSDASSPSRRRPAAVLGPSTSWSSEGTVQQLSRSAKKRRKRHERKKQREQAEEQRKLAEPRSDPEKGDDRASQVEETSSSVLSVQQSVEREEGETSAEIPGGSTSATQLSPDLGEGETWTQGPSSSVSSSQDPPKLDEGETITEPPGGSKWSTQDSPKRDEGETYTGPSGRASTQDTTEPETVCTEGPSGSTSTQDTTASETACTEGPSGSTSTQDTTESETVCAEGPSTSTAPTQDTSKRDVSTSTETPSSISPSGTERQDTSICIEGSSESPLTEDITKSEAVLHTEGPASSTTQGTVKHEMSAPTELPGSSSSTHQQSSQPSDTQSAQGTSQTLSPSALLPGSSKYQSTFPTIEEIRGRIRWPRIRTTSRTEHQGSPQKDTDSSLDTAQKTEGGAALKDTESAKRSRSKSAESASGSRIGAGGDSSDAEDSPDTGSFRSSIEPSWVFEDTFRDLHRERKREEYILSAVSKCASVSAALAGHYTQVIAEIFSDSLLGSEEAGPSGVGNGNANGNDNGNADTTGDEPPEYDDTHAEVLEDIRYYVQQIYADVTAHRTPSHVVSPADLEALVGAFNAAAAELAASQPSSQSSPPVPVEVPTDPESEPSTSSQEQASSSTSAQVEPVAHCSKQPEAGTSTSSQEQASSSTSAQVEPVAHCSKQPDPTASWRGETSPRRAFLQKHVYNILSVAACRVSKMRGSWIMFFNGIESLLNILNLALEAYIGVQQVVDRVVRPPYAAANGIVGAVTEGAFSSSEHLRRALFEAERAVRIHYEFTSTLYELQQLLVTLNPRHPKAHEVTDRNALLEQVISILDQSCDVIDMEWLRSGAGPDSGAASPTHSEGKPLLGFETLLVAAQVALQALEAAMTSVDVIYAYELGRAAETQDDSDYTDDED